MIHAVTAGDKIRDLAKRYGVPVGTIVNDNSALLGWKSEDAAGSKLVPAGPAPRGISLEALPIIKPGDRLNIAEVVREPQQPVKDEDNTTVYAGGILLLFLAFLKLRRKKKR